MDSVREKPQECCEVCRFYDMVGDEGACRRYPPIIPPSEDHIKQMEDLDMNGEHPWVHGNDWCGEFKEGGR